MASVVVVGASRGLGRAFVEEHLKRGWDVVATVREPAALAELRDLDRLWIEVLETSDWHGIDSLNANL